MTFPSCSSFYIVTIAPTLALFKDREHLPPGACFESASQIICTLQEECHKIIFSLNTHKTRAPARAPEPNSQNYSTCLSVFSGNSLNINKCPRMTLCYPPYSESFSPYLYIYKSFPSRKPWMLWHSWSLLIIPYSRRSASSLRRQWQLLHMSLPLPTLLSISYPPVMMCVGWGTTLKLRFRLQKSSVCQPGKP
jgi:hypothetical protein